MKTKGQIWPILGICQGHEVLAIINEDDDIRTLDPVVIYG